MNLTAVLYLPALTRSVSFRPYLAQLNSQPVLRILSNKILRRCGADRMIVLHHYPAEGEQLNEALKDSGAELRLTPHYAELAAVAEISAEDPEARIAVLRMGFALTPADLLHRVVRFHSGSKNDCTLLTEMPEDCGLCLCEPQALEQIVQLADTLSFSGVESAVRRLLALQKMMPERAPLRLTCAPFNFCESYETTPQQMPLSAPLHEEHEVALAEEAVHRTEQEDPDSAAILIALKAIQTRQKAAGNCLPENCHLPAIQPAPQPPRVLYLSLPSAFSGAEQSLCSMVRFVDHQRYEPWAVTLRSGVFADTLRQAGAQVVCPEGLYIDANCAAFSYLLQLFRRVRPSILHMNSSASLSALAAASVCNIPIVTHLRNSDMGGYEDSVVQASALIAVSEFVKKEALRFSIDAQKMHVIYDETDCERFSPELFNKAECRRELGLDESDKIVLMVARVVEHKRHDLMLEAAGLVRTRIPNFRLVLKGDIYGDSLYHRQLQNLQKMLDLDEIVRWMDFVPDMRKLMAAADLLVLCSEREALGSCVVEAMSMGLPVVVTNSGGTHEIVPREVGFAVPSNDAGLLAARIIDLLRDEALCQRMGSAGREYARTHLDGRISAQKVMGIYDSILDKATD